MIIRDVAFLRNLLAREFMKLFSVDSFILCSLSFHFHLGFPLAAPVLVCIFSLLLPYFHTVVPADSSILVICTSCVESKKSACLYLDVYVYAVN